ncbi:MAG TPA: carboxy terminal-processing peptidase [Spirochaetota bacterium]|nr:carboxy terminal-processing peptidase [Spirochaetota bacterium]HSA14730.1 carboxy terminal-processing peptidase [Spirochaetota bacterium]
MPRTSRYLFFILAIIIAAGNAEVKADSLSEKTINLLNIMHKFHYQDLPLDERVAAEIQNIFIDSLDPLRIIFTRSDVEELFSVKIDFSGLRSGKKIPFFARAIQCFHDRLENAERIISDTIRGELDYKIQETIDLDDRPKFPENESELKRRWNKYVKYKILKYFFHKMYNDHQLKDYRELFISEEPAMRALVEKREKNIIGNILNPPGGFENLMSALFLDAIAMRYDPHSRYLSLKDKMNFETGLSSRGLSYGVFFRTSMTGEVRIDRLVPGGPAWKSGKLNKDDIITEIRFPLEGDKILYIEDLSPGGLDGLINNAKTDTVVITAVKTNGRVVKATLVKEKIEIEKNVINSFILKGERKIGYICLPAFYMEWDRPGAPSSANDVAIEIMKLKNEHVEGVILDLRDNSGGSLIEAMQLAGIFIDEGPLFIQDSRGGRPLIIKDPSRGTVYDGPFVVMVNGQSASASEFFAGAMKDYNRAVIVGSPTFGKASSQVLLPLVADMEKIAKGTVGKNHADYVLTTTSLYYNLSLKTHQLNGVSPDIGLPDISGVMYDTEKTMRYSLKPGKITKDVRFERRAKLPVEELRRLSRERVSNNSGFSGILVFNNEMKKFSSAKKDISLNIDIFIREMNSFAQSANTLGKKTIHASQGFTVSNTAYDSDLYRLDRYKNDMNEQSRKQVNEDIYIDEAYSVIKDQIKNNSARGK